MTDSKNPLLHRIKVGKNTIFTAYKDKIAFAGVLFVCAIVLIVAWWPSHSKSSTLDASDTRTSKDKTTLQQNLAYIAGLRQEKKVGNTDTLPNKPAMAPVVIEEQNTEENKELLVRMNAPTTFYVAESRPVVSDKTSSPQALGISNADPNTQFLNQQESITSASAKTIPHPLFTIPAGEMLAATVETAIDSELAGMVRAITAQNSYGLTGNKVLIPKGSILVGQFNTAVSEGQTRVFVAWNRLQLPNGVIITLASPITDSLGRSGMAADAIDRHFFQQFGMASLLSVLGAYSANSGISGVDEYNSKSSYRMSLSQGFQQASRQTLAGSMQIKPTLSIHQGTMINVFVAHDLDFYSVRAKI